MLQFILFLSIFIISMIFLVVFFRSYMKIKQRNFAILNYEMLYTMLQNAVTIAYDKAFKEDVLVSTSSGYRLNKEELTKIRANYIKDVFSICGDSVINDLELVHGSLDSLVIYLANDFTNKVLKDESDILNTNNAYGEEEMWKGIGVNR